MSGHSFPHVFAREMCHLYSWWFNCCFFLCKDRSSSLFLWFVFLKCMFNCGGIARDFQLGEDGC
jgi:hypothetical protein